MLSPVGIFATPWTIQSMGFSRPQYWSGEPFPSPGYLPSPGIEPRSSTLQVDSLPAELQGKPKNTGKKERKKESEVTQSCSILWDPVDCSLSGSSIRGIFQAGVLEWVAISFSRGSSWPRGETQVSRIAGRCFTLWATREALWVLEWVAYPFSNGSSQSRDWTHCCNRPGFNPWIEKIHWRRKWQPTPVFLPGEFHGQRSLVGYSPWGHKESDITEWLSLSLLLLLLLLDNCLFLFIY